MWNPFRRRKAKKAAKPRPKKRRVPLTIEQLEPIKLFNGTSLTLLEQMGLFADDNFDDLDNDFDVLGKRRHNGGGGIAAAPDSVIHTAPVGDSSGGGASHQTNLSVSGGGSTALGSPSSPTGGSTQPLVASATSNKTTSVASGPPSPNSTTVISNASGGSGTPTQGPIMSGPGGAGPDIGFCFACGSPAAVVIDANEALV